MSLFIQHGHAKSDRIHTALEDNSAQGVVFGARTEKPDNLERCIDQLRKISADAELWFDPQFFISALTPPNERYLSEYEYYSPGRAITDFTPRKMRQYAQQTLDAQTRFNLSGYISPTVLWESFSDRWYQVALNMADATIEQYQSMDTDRPLLISFMFNEHALDQGRQADEFLDTVTQTDWDVSGFYLTVCRDEGPYNQNFDPPERLARWLYMVYVLGGINDLRVICGYSDFVGMLLRAVGAEAFATGWSQGLRRCLRGSFVRKDQFARQPRLRYSSAPLWNSILLSELQQIDDVGKLDDALSDVDLDDVIRGASSPESSNWNTDISQLHHWQTLHKLDDEFDGDVAKNVSDLLGSLAAAQDLYRDLISRGVTFEQHTNGEHITDWRKALRQFQGLAGIPVS